MNRGNIYNRILLSCILSLIILSLLYPGTLHIHKVTGKLSVIDILDLEVTEKQLRSLLSAITSSSNSYNDIYLNFIDSVIIY